VAKIFFRLRHVPDDEADEVRQMLDDHSIPWFETSAGRWGISFPAIWLKDDRDQVRARELLDACQQQRVEKIRSEEAERRQRGEHSTVMSQFIQRPVRTVLAVLFIAVIIYFSVTPFLSLYKTI
jgi:hypothetical protein